MKFKALGAFTVSIVALSASSGAAPKPPPTASVADVINRVKEELDILNQAPNKLVRKSPPGALCTDANGDNVVFLQPTKEVLTLKTVAVNENDPSLGLAIPLHVLSIDPSYSGAYSMGQTQSLEVDFEAPQSTSAAKARELVPDPKKNPLAAAVMAMALGLLETDHTKKPCLKPTGLKAVLTFDVVNKTTVGADIDIYVFKMGDKEVVSNEAHQTLEFDFTLTGSSLMIME